MKTKIVYIAHPIGGDVENNLKKVTFIAREINLKEPNTVPFAQFFLDCYALDDTVPEERARGIKNNTIILKRKFIDEVRLYGDKISNGMFNEILLADKLGIKVIAMTEGTKRDLELMRKSQKYGKKS